MRRNEKGLFQNSAQLSPPPKNLFRSLPPLPYPRDTAPPPSITHWDLATYPAQPLLPMAPISLALSGPTAPRSGTYLSDELMNEPKKGEPL